jgi:hypothetical protein
MHALHLAAFLAEMSGGGTLGPALWDGFLQTELASRERVNSIGSADRTQRVAVRSRREGGE